MKSLLAVDAQPTVKRRMHDGAMMQENKTLDSAFWGRIRDRRRMVKKRDTSIDQIKQGHPGHRRVEEGWLEQQSLSYPKAPANQQHREAATKGDPATHRHMHPTNRRRGLAQAKDSGYQVIKSCSPFIGSTQTALQPRRIGHGGVEPMWWPLGVKRHIKSQHKCGPAT